MILIMENVEVYIYLYIYIYIVCDNCCKECRGPGNNHCVENKCNKENNCYPLEVLPTTCIRDCMISNSNLNSIPPLYLDTSTPNSEMCRECHPNCLICYGSENNTCLECTPPKLLTQERECIYEQCPPSMNTFITDTKCEKCNDKCKGCRYSPSNCLGCEFPYLFFQKTNSCLTTCPNQFYADLQNSICQGNIYIYIYIFRLSRQLSPL